MIAELTAEQIVTNLLSSGEIISPSKEQNYVSNKFHDLGEYLQNLPSEVIAENPQEDSSAKNSKYIFVKEYKPFKYIKNSL